MPDPTVGPPDHEGRCLVSGVLDLGSAAHAAAQGRARIRAGSPLVFDLSGVTHADSAALAVLVEWAREARARGGEVRFENLTGQLGRLAAAARVEPLLARGKSA